jgi:glutamate synthase (NADPH) small chain
MAELTKRERMQMDRTGMPIRGPGTRVGDFDEVTLGYTSAMAVLEASRCLNCTHPVCVEGCPVGVRIGDFVRLVADGDIAGAAAVIHEDNVLPSVCGRVCPQEIQCEGACVLAKKGRPIAIGYLERYVADEERTRMLVRSTPAPERTGRRVAVVGSGPAGLACAGDLIRMGHDVTVFEALHEFGGVLAYGIPAFRLPKEIVKAEVEALAASGVVFESDVLVGSAPTLDELMSEHGFDAVFVGTGAGLPRFPGVEGENLIGVYSANEFLTRVNLMHANDPDGRTPVYDLEGRPVVVIGGGNTAVDAARTARRLGGEPVTMLYRRTGAEMPARAEEIDHAREEGVAMQFLVGPVEFRGQEGWLSSVMVQRMRLGDPDESGRAFPEPIPGAVEEIAADVAIIAIGNAPNPILMAATPDLATTTRGTVSADPQSGATSIPGVFAGGDITTGGATVILALGAGRRAAASIDRWLAGTSVTGHEPGAASPDASGSAECFS